MTTARKRRGRESEHLVAARMRALWPLAEAVGSGAPGVDVKHTPGYAVEVKARGGLDLPAWMRQARKNAGNDCPVLVIRLNGQGPATIGDWPVVLTLDDFLRLVRDATALGG